MYAILRNFFFYFDDKITMNSIKIPLIWLVFRKITRRAQINTSIATICILKASSQHTLSLYWTITLLFALVAVPLYVVACFTAMIGLWASVILYYISRSHSRIWHISQTDTMPCFFLPFFQYRWMVKTVRKPLKRSLFTVFQTILSEKNQVIFDWWSKLEPISFKTSFYPLKWWHYDHPLEHLLTIILMQLSHSCT